MVWSFVYSILLVCLYVCSLESFEVKVLLQKIKLSDLTGKSIDISSQHGFMLSRHATLSLGKELQRKTISISKRNNQFFIGNEPLHGVYYISPLLSSEQKQIAYNLVQTYFTKHHEKLLQLGEVLESFFEYFTNKKSEINSLSYDLLRHYTEQVVQLFFKEITQDCADLDSVVSIDTLMQQAVEFMQYRIKDEFTQQLVTKKLTHKDRKLLQNNKTYRYDFFIRHVHNIIQKLLKDFLKALPRNAFALLHDQEIECLSYDGNYYRGTFALLTEGEALYLVNCLDIDDYLLSVIRNEGWPGWPLEVNKVLAVACRTYLVWQVLQAQKMKRPYHIENGIRHQTYKGHHKYARLKKAVDETKDICIAAGGKPILAMFDACCGGVVSGDIALSPDFQKHQYLLRKDQCTYCKSCKVSTWKAEIRYDDMLTLLQKEIPSLVHIDAIAVTRRDKAGLVQEVTVDTKGTKVTISGKKMYSLFPEIKSFCFDVEVLPRVKSEKKGFRKLKKDALAEQQGHLYTGEKRFLITGKGYGHHVGLCQWGAMKLVKEHHWNYQRILQFYYPGTTLIKLHYKR